MNSVGAAHIKILALVPHRKGHAPGQRGSIELWERVLAEEGIEIVYAPFETEKLRSILYAAGNQWTKASEMVKGYVERLKLLSRLDEYDAVFVYREAALLGPAFLEKRIAKRKPIIYQLDDPLFVPYRSPSNGYLSYLKFFGKVKEIVRLSTVVIVNSTQIRGFAEQYNSSLWQIPSIVDTSKFVYEPFTENPERVCVGWSGSPTTLKNIRLIERPLQELSRAGNCDIYFIGGEDLGLADVRYTAQKWNAATEVEDLRRMHVGLVPLPENAWNKYKFIMKTAQYMALGIVPVGTPMASNTEVIRHGENGFLAANDNEWLELLNTLIADDKLRNEMSARAAADARAKYSLEANRTKIIEAFRAAVRNDRDRP
jgi:glycosyltransferase involved in cell wall biosynthesis